MFERIDEAQRSFVSLRERIDEETRERLREALALANERFAAAQKSVAKKRPFWEAEEAIAEVSRIDFETSDGVEVRGGVVKGAAADYGNGHARGGYNCFANAEAQEARCVYGLDVFPFRNPEQWDEAGYEESARKAMADGEYIPTSKMDSEKTKIAVLERLRDAPDGTFLRNIGEVHTNGFVKQDGDVYFVDAYSAKRYMVNFDREAKHRDHENGTIPIRLCIGRYVSAVSHSTKSGEEYTGLVYIKPSKERAKYLARSKFLVGKRENSGLDA